ncbi:hypothetical protein D1O30_07535 [Methylocystis hirsuta]|uniref:Uncharacterized protein n=2 Tax=Methylocystis hirsuta TaxID=369798 RepID=A0A3M9XN99_9HYPH|nr:hypothetical protein D1O30_07535 [Methylocystis hirsuta]
MRRAFFCLTLWITVAWAIPVRAQQPNIIFTPDPAKAVVTQVHVNPETSIFEHVDPRLGNIVYEVGNLGWDDDMRNLDFSLWALVGGQLVRIHQQKAAFLGRGESIMVKDLPRPFALGRMAVCVSYEFKGRKVNVIDFYTNENLLSARGYAGKMNKFRESLTQVDGPDDLCRSMPETAARFM